MGLCFLGVAIHPLSSLQYIPINLIYILFTLPFTFEGREFYQGYINIYTFCIIYYSGEYQKVPILRASTFIDIKFDSWSFSIPPLSLSSRFSLDGILHISLTSHFLPSFSIPLYVLSHVSSRLPVRQNLFVYIPAISRFRFFLYPFFHVCYLIQYSDSCALYLSCFFIRLIPSSSTFVYSSRMSILCCHAIVSSTSLRMHP